ncbi:MAG: glycosyltransferase [Candidatus Helarchaeota archaeon]
MVVSVVIPTYNHERTIKELVDMLLNQNKQYKMEIIIVDDKSSDRTPEILKSMNGIKYIINEKNLGLAGSLNVGIQNSSGDFIWIIHGDCIPHEGFLKNALKAFDEYPDVGVICAHANLPFEIWENYNFYDKVFHLKEMIRYNEDLKTKKFFKDPKGLCGGMKTAIFRRTVLYEIDLFNSEKFRAAGEDGDTVYKIRKTKWKILKIDYPSKHLHAINKTSIKSQFKKIIRLNEAKGTLLRTYKRIALDNAIKNRYWNPITITIFYLLILIAFIFDIFINIWIFTLFKWTLFLVFILELLFYTFKTAKHIPNWRVITLPFIKFIKNICIAYGFWKGFISNKQRI